jgi:hypothetical protein
VAGCVNIFLVLSEGFTLLQLRTDFSGEMRVYSGKKRFGNVILVGYTSGDWTERGCVYKASAIEQGSIWLYNSVTEGVACVP